MPSFIRLVSLILLTWTLDDLNLHNFQQLKLGIDLPNLIPLWLLTLLLWTSNNLTLQTLFKKSSLVFTYQISFFFGWSLFPFGYSDHRFLNSFFEDKNQCFTSRLTSSLTPKSSRSIAIKMSSASEHDVHQCLNCPKSATHTCKGCKAMPNATDGQISSAWYCGAECQKAHWTEHKTQCKAAQARQALYRAGAMLQQIFYLYSKITFTWSPGPVEKIGTTWLIHTSEYTGTSHLMPFPYAMVPDVQDQEALLTYQSCSSAVSQMHNVVNVFLRGKSFFVASTKL